MPIEHPGSPGLQMFRNVDLRRANGTQRAQRDDQRQEADEVCHHGGFPAAAR
jgi:hypothetical protein